jgi:hypothetical protein
MQRVPTLLRIVFSVLSVSLWGHAQEPAPTAPPSATPPATVTQPGPPVLQNQGKPMVVVYNCSEQDVQWAGLSCNEDEPCAVFLELSAVEAAGNRIVVAGNLHTEAVTLYSLLLASEDNGRTWTEAHERIRGAALDHIQFLDANTGWISGGELFPIPQNPFLLVTTDGGKTWEQRPILGESAEDRFGSVQQFAFTDKDNGSLILDRAQSGSGARYALFESRTGGGGWNIVQESSKPLRLKQTAPVSTWRVRVDAATHSFHIEHRQGERWTSVAAFAVKLPPCK